MHAANEKKCKTRVLWGQALHTTSGGERTAGPMRDAGVGEDLHARGEPGGRHDAAPAPQNKVLH